MAHQVKPAVGVEDLAGRRNAKVAVYGLAKRRVGIPAEIHVHAVFRRERQLADLRAGDDREVGPHVPPEHQADIDVKAADRMLRVAGIPGCRNFGVALDAAPAGRAHANIGREVRRLRKRVFEHHRGIAEEVGRPQGVTAHERFRFNVPEAGRQRHLRQVRAVAERAATQLPDALRQRHLGQRGQSAEAIAFQPDAVIHAQRPLVADAVDALGRDERQVNARVVVRTESRHRARHRHLDQIRTVLVEAPVFQPACGRRERDRRQVREPAERAVPHADDRIAVDRLGDDEPPVLRQRPHAREPVVIAAQDRVGDVHLLLLVPLPFDVIAPLGLARERTRLDRDVKRVLVLHHSRELRPPLGKARIRRNRDLGQDARIEKRVVKVRRHRAQTNDLGEVLQSGEGAVVHVTDAARDHDLVRTRGKARQHVPVADEGAVLLLKLARPPVRELDPLEVRAVAERGQRDVSLRDQLVSDDRDLQVAASGKGVVVRAVDISRHLRPFTAGEETDQPVAVVAKHHAAAERMPTVFGVVDLLVADDHLAEVRARAEVAERERTLVIPERGRRHSLEKRAAVEDDVPVRHVIVRALLHRRIPANLRIDVEQHPALDVIRRVIVPVVEFLSVLFIAVHVRLVHLECRQRRAAAERLLAYSLDARQLQGRDLVHAVKRAGRDPADRLASPRRRGLDRALRRRPHAREADEDVLPGRIVPLPPHALAAQDTVLNAPLRLGRDSALLKGNRLMRLGCLGDEVGPALRKARIRRIDDLRHVREARKHVVEAARHAAPEDELRNGAQVALDRAHALHRVRERDRREVRKPPEGIARNAGDREAVHRPRQLERPLGRNAPHAGITAFRIGPTVQERTVAPFRRRAPLGPGRDRRREDDVAQGLVAGKPRRRITPVIHEPRGRRIDDARARTRPGDRLDAARHVTREHDFGKSDHAGKRRLADGLDRRRDRHLLRTRGEADQLPSRVGKDQAVAEDEVVLLLARLANDVHPLEVRTRGEGRERHVLLGNHPFRDRHGLQMLAAVEHDSRLRQLVVGAFLCRRIPAGFLVITKKYAVFDEVRRRVFLARIVPFGHLERRERRAAAERLLADPCDARQLERRDLVHAVERARRDLVDRRAGPRRRDLHHALRRRPHARIAVRPERAVFIPANVHATSAQGAVLDVPLRLGRDPALHEGDADMVARRPNPIVLVARVRRVNDRIEVARRPDELVKPFRHAALEDEARDARKVTPKVVDVPDRVRQRDRRQVRDARKRVFAQPHQRIVPNERREHEVDRRLARAPERRIPLVAPQVSAAFQVGVPHQLARLHRLERDVRQFGNQDGLRLDAFPILGQPRLAGIDDRPQLRRFRERQQVVNLRIAREDDPRHIGATGQRTFVQPVVFRHGQRPAPGPRHTPEIVAVH